MKSQQEKLKEIVERVQEINELTATAYREITQTALETAIKAIVGLTPGLSAIQLTMELVKLSKEILNHRDKEVIKEKIDSVAIDLTPKSQSVVEIMIDKREKNTQKAYLIFTITLLGQIAFALLSNSEINYWLTALILFLAGMVYLNQAIIVYRVKNGLYGSNDDEAREIVEFIFKNAEHIDFNDGHGKKKILPELEKEEKEAIIPEGGIAA